MFPVGFFGVVFDNVSIYFSFHKAKLMTCIMTLKNKYMIR